MRRLALFVAVLALAPTAAAMAAGPSFTFALGPPNVAKDPTTGDMIRLTGAGAFDPAAGTVRASGTITHFNADGSVLHGDTWVATGFKNFTSFGGFSPGVQGGILEIMVTVFIKGEAPIEDVPMTITCDINAPPGVHEGTTLGPFTEKVSGFNKFAQVG